MKIFAFKEVNKEEETDRIISLVNYEEGYRNKQTGKGKYFKKGQVGTKNTSSHLRVVVCIIC